MIKDHLRKIMHLENRVEEEACRADMAEAAVAEMREAARKLANSASRLAIAAQTMGGVAGRDEGLCVAIDRIAHPLGVVRSLVEKGGERVQLTERDTIEIERAILTNSEIVQDHLEGGDNGDGNA